MSHSFKSDILPVENLIGELYETLVDATKWAQVLSDIVKITDSAAVYFHVTDLDASENITSFAHNIAQENQQIFERDYLRLCPRLAFLRQSNSNIFYDYLHIDEQQIRKDPLYSWLGSHDLKYYAGLRVSVAERIAAVLSLQRSPVNGGGITGHLAAQKSATSGLGCDVGVG